MSITVFFPESFSWQDAHHWVANRALPVTMVGPLDAIFEGQTFQRYCEEVDYDAKRMCVFYHRDRVEMRRGGVSTASTQAAQAEQTARTTYHAHLEGCTEGCLPNGEQHCPEGAGLLWELARVVTESVRGAEVAAVVAVLLLVGIVAAWRVPMLPVVEDGYLTVTLACLVEEHE